MLVMGIDEAGRGPVIGPLVICGLVVNEEDHQKLKDIGAKDSKLLSAKQRENLVAGIRKLSVSHKIVIIQPQEIDDAVNKEGTNLNWLEADHAISIINELKPDLVHIDCPSPNIRAYTEYIKERLTCKTEVHCCHHADRDYPVVSGASILAKVTRDAEVAKIHKSIGADFGSGYAHDPLTRAFLEKYWNKYPDIFRHSWKSWKDQVDKLKQGKLDDF